MSQEVDQTQIRQISLADKKEIMWNAIEPGDPYDIRKSMIARLPGRPNFMGPHLELVCLLQAAEIERLTLCLEEHSLKYPEKDQDCDRKKEWIWIIKELSEKLLLEEGLRSENDKLKEFIRRQSKQLEQIQRSQDFSSLKKKYEDSLNQVEELLRQKASLGQTIEQLGADLSRNREELRSVRDSSVRDSAIIESSFKKDLQAYQEKLREKEKLYGQYEEETKQKIEAHLRSLEEYEERFHVLAGEIDRLNCCLREKSLEISQEHLKHQQILEEKRQLLEQKEEVEVEKAKLLSQVANLEKQYREVLKQKSSYQQRELTIQQYESRVQRLSIEVDRLNNVLRKKVNELEENRRKIKDQELALANYHLLERETDELRAKFSETSQQLFIHEKQQAIQAQEIDRLNLTLQKMTHQINDAEIRLKNSEKELSTQVQKCVVLETDREQLTKTQNELAQTNNQLITQLKTENQHLQTKMVNFQRIYEENNVLKAELEQLSQERAEEKKMFTSQSLDYQKQLQGLRDFNKEAATKEGGDESAGIVLQLKGQLERVESENQNLKEEVKVLRGNREEWVVEKEERKRCSDELGQYYKKVLMFSEEISRLNSVLETKEREILEYHENLVDYKEKIKFCEDNIQFITAELEHCKAESSESRKRQQVNKAQLVNNELANMKDSTHQITSYQGKITVMGQEIERLNTILKTKVQQIEDLHKANRTLKEQMEVVEIRDSQRHGSEKVLQGQRNEMERLDYLLKQKEEDMRRQTQEHARIINNCTGEINRLSVIVSKYQLEIGEQKGQIDRLNSLLTCDNNNQKYQIEQKDKNYLCEIERLNNLLRIKVQESEGKARQYKTYAQEIQSLKDNLNRERKERDQLSQQKELLSQEVTKTKQQICTYEFRIKELYDEFERLQTVMKALKEENETISELKSDYQDLIQKNHWLGSEVDRLQAINDRLEDDLKEIHNSLANESCLERRVKEDLGLVVIVFAQVESLRKRVVALEREEKQLRKRIARQYRV